MTTDEINPDGVALLISEIVISAARDLCGRASAAAQETAREFLTAAGLADRADLIYRHAEGGQRRRSLLGLYCTPLDDRRLAGVVARPRGER